MSCKSKRKSWQEKLEDSKGLPKVETINQIREILARKHNATICCPITNLTIHQL